MNCKYSAVNCLLSSTLQRVQRFSISLKSFSPYLSTTFPDFLFFLISVGCGCDITGNHSGGIRLPVPQIGNEGPPARKQRAIASLMIL